MGRERIDFNKRIFDKSHIPVIDIKVFDRYFSFVLDSGASSNYIHSEFFEALKQRYSVIETCKNNTMTGVSGDKVAVGSTVLKISVADRPFTMEKFDVYDMSNVLNFIVERANTVVEGIIGTEFMAKYSWMLDFNDQCVWLQ